MRDSSQDNEGSAAHARKGLDWPGPWVAAALPALPPLPALPVVGAVCPGRNGQGKGPLLGQGGWVSQRERGKGHSAQS